MKKHFIGKCILFGILGIALVIGFTYVVMLLWNWLIPDLFAGPVLDFWQAGGLLILSKILFSGFGKGCGRCKGPKVQYWKHKLEHMSPEEKEKLKSKWKCWGESCD
jgi:hypothetical protein